jgi:hypothetical protein
MPEEEEGFTFVDKRRTQAVDIPESESGEQAGRDESQAAAASPSSDLDSDNETGETDIYGILGYFTSLLATEAWQKLGLIANPQTGEAKADLAQARVAIDTVGDLVARLEGAPDSSVPQQARRELRTLLNDLRLNYVSRQNQLP